MKITIVNRKGPKDVQTKPYPIDITMPALFTALWNIEEKPHGKFWQKYNPDAKMSIDEAQAILNEHFKKAKNGEIRETIKAEKHQSAKKYLGLTLIGNKGDFGIIWREAYIDQPVFLKHRDETSANSILDNLMLTLSRESIKKHALSKDRNKEPVSPNDIPNTVRPGSDDIRVEPINPSNPNQPSSSQTESWIKRVLKSPLLHGLITSGVAGVGLFFSKVGTGIMIGGSLGAGLLTWAVESLYFWRKNKMTESYQEFEKMSHADMQALSPDVKQALNAGLDSKAWVSWGKSIFDTSAWKNYNAYSAGLKASESEADVLAEKIRARAKI